MAEPFIGQLMCVGFNFAPRGWSTCDGQTVAIAQNSALFSLLGITYGGDGRVTFKLPDLRGRAAIHQGAGPGLAPYAIGEPFGVETVTLTAPQMPQHTHAVAANAGDLNDQSPAGRFPSGGGAYNSASNTTMNPAMVGAAGGNTPHENRPPSLTLNWIIALEGIFPSRG